MVAVSPRKGKEKKQDSAIRTTFGVVGCVLLLPVFWIAHVVFVVEQNPTGVFDVLSSDAANNQQQQQQLQLLLPQPQQNVLPSSSSSSSSSYRNGFLKKYSSTICSQLLKEAKREVQEHHAAKVQRQAQQKSSSAAAAAKKNKKNENENKESGVEPDEDGNDNTRLVTYVLDPNHGEIHARLTTTDPSFWISTHNASFDPVRAGIMKKGQYYEFKMTGHVQSMLKSDNATAVAEEEETPENGEKNKKKGGRKKGIVVDVGMNIGWYSMLAASMGRDVVAFEPNTFHHVRACQSLGLNGWDDGSSGVNEGGDNNSNSNNNNGNHDDGHEERTRPPRVRMYEYGVGDEAGEFYLNFERKSSGSAKISSASAPRKDDNDDMTKHSNKGAVQTITNANGDFVTVKNLGGNREPIVSYTRKVKVLTLDEFAREEGWFEDKVRISLLKVDVEGAEEQVFMGAAELLKSGLVENVLGEFTLGARGVSGTPKKAFTGFVEVVSLLHGAGYCLYLIGNWAGDGTKFENYKKQKEFPWESKHADYSRDLASYLFDYCAETNQGQPNMWWIECKE